MSTRLEEYGGASTVEGVIVYQKNWYLLQMPKDFHKLMAEKVKNLDENFVPSKRPHISVMKKEAPSINQEQWGIAFVGERVEVQYSATIRQDNGFHYWIDCYSSRLCEMREYFALPTLKRNGVYLVNFHMTIGRREKPVEFSLREQIRICPQSHIDVETGMQHL